MLFRMTLGRHSLRFAGGVQITGTAGLGVGPSVYYNRGQCSVQVCMMHTPYSHALK